ncbi:ATP-binding protein [Bacillus cereus]|nr:ATP-binding protein [Bacillus cereus]MCU5542988.1 ATP-binding protein [Bacillus cereus]HDR4895650.1 ATP-binding protein [Bacillus cereus]
MSLLNINAVHTFLQIVQNSRKPLEVIREAIANAYDNGANNLDIIVDYSKKDDSINITFKDNGTGISKKDIEYYIFGLGNSTKLNAKGYIGNKGVGTLLFLKSKSLTVTSFVNGKGARQKWINPYKSLVEFRNNNSSKDLTREDLGIQDAEDIVYKGEQNGTIIHIEGFLHRNPLEYHHENLTDFTRWFTKMGSFEKDIKTDENRPFTVNLKGLLFQEVRDLGTLNTDEAIETGYDSYINKRQIATREKFQEIQYGFPFPPLSDEEELILDTQLLGMDSTQIEKELKKNLVIKFTSNNSDFNDLLSFTYRDSLDKQQDATIEFVVFRIGENIRNKHNTMIKRLTNQLPSYKYLVSERYGIYLAKDYIPVQLINSDLQSIGGGGHGKTQYLGFFNCQNIDLTIDRTGAATIDEELQIKLNNRINKLMVKIDKKVNKRIKTLLEKIENQKTLVNPDKTNNTLPDDNNGKSNSTEANNRINKNTFTDSDNDTHKNTFPEANNEQDTGKNLFTQTEKTEIQDRKRRKAERIHRIKLKKQLTTLTLEDRELILREPNYESELYGILMQLTTLNPDIIHFNILDYNTTKGFDILAKKKECSDINLDNLFHVELKAKLTSNMNHLLADARYIICWTIDEGLRRNMILRDKFQNLYILDKDDEGLFLKNDPHSHIVRIIELKDLIEKHFGQFTVRTISINL